ncbi:glycosyltransferase family 2 protein [Candidatus Cyanaurora vandensis]|nr:glycosyltransferase family 2 protein [Candidatus Cyanaurora vandensis]
MLSVAMCTYNGARYLPEQLASIANQTLLPNEMVICDDASQDQTVAVLREFAQGVPFPVHLHCNPQNLGSTKNFEQAIGRCVGTVIALADQDDRWQPHKLATLDAALRAQPRAGYVFSDANLVDANTQPIGESLWSYVRSNVPKFRHFTPTEQLAVLFQGNIVTGATMALRKQLTPWLFPIPADWVHDAWIALISSALGWYGIALSEPLIDYRLHRNQQLGVHKATNPAPSTDRTRYQELRRREQQAIDVLTHLRSVPSGLDLTATFTRFEAQRKHFTNRAALREQLATRLSVVFQEGVTGRYFQFSGAWRSILRDLFF